MTILSLTEGDVTSLRNFRQEETIKCLITCRDLPLPACHKTFLANDGCWIPMYSSVFSVPTLTLMEQRTPLLGTPHLNCSEAQGQGSVWCEESSYFLVKNAPHILVTQPSLNHLGSYKSKRMFLFYK